MRPLLLAFLILAPLVLASTAEARTDSKRYVAGPEFYMIRFGALNVGGVEFAPQGTESAVTIEAVDEVAGAGVLIFVCQDTDADGACGPGDREAGGCGPVTLTGLDATKTVYVWIGTASTAVVGCTLAPATRGIVHATFV